MEITISQSVPFHDIDIMGIVWHGHYYKYFELARCALHEKIGIDWPEVKKMGYAMPIIHSECSYRQPMEYGNEVFISSWITDPELAALETYYKIIFDNKVLAKGMTRQAYFDINSRQSLLECPPEIKAVFDRYSF